MVARDRKSRRPNPSSGSRRSEARLRKLGDALRAKYADVQNEPIPERLRDLIDALRDAERKEGESD